MKSWILFFFMLVGVQGWGQSDTLWISEQKFADSIYRNLSGRAQTGFLLNKMLSDSSNVLLNNTHLFNGESTTYYSNADMVYRFLTELQRTNTSNLESINPLTIYDTVSVYVAQNEFEKEIFVYPFSILDFNVNEIDENLGVQLGILSNSELVIQDLQPNNHSIVKTLNAKIIGPLYDLSSSDVMGIIFRKQDFYSNHRSWQNVSSIEVKFTDNWYAIDWDVQYGFFPKFDSIQNIWVKVVFETGDTLINRCRINTPLEEFTIKSKSKFEIGELFELDEEVVCGLNFNAWEPGCNDCGEISDDDGNSLKWCLIPSCTRESSRRPLKPYILLTGYRPPIIGQSFKKTWKIYNQQHHFLLDDIRANDYDVILVKFNIHIKPKKHGMQESAALLEQFINYLNEEYKENDDYENVIQGSSMGSDIARLTLLKMEKLHFEDQNYPNHHTRLFIAHDGNFYGASLPLSVQYHIYSEWNYQSLLNTSYLGIPVFLKLFLYSTMNQKTVKELLTYHALANDNDLFSTAYYDGNFKPTHHSLRQSYYDALSNYDNHKYNIPMQQYTRNIAISLGDYKRKNSEVFPGDYPAAGDYYYNFDLGLKELRWGTAKYMSAPQNYNIYRRKNLLSFGIGFGSGNLFFGTKHNIDVTEMQEIDATSGSYLGGAGNIISVARLAYFGIFFDKFRFPHKPVVTALGINETLWPNNGNMTLNLQTMGLMFSGVNLIGQPILSDKYGYPHLGYPNNHYQITPFDAIYCDDQIDRHIVLIDATQEYKQALNNFIYNELEPWYLALQNQYVGAQARSNYQYRVSLQARNVIQMGDNVTSITPVGEYITESNSKVSLRAGDEIQVKKGTHFKPGSDVHLFIGYSNCAVLDKTSPNNSEISSVETTSKDYKPASSVNPIRIFPNPFSQKLTIQVEGHEIQRIEIFDLYGKLVFEKNFENLENVDIQSNLNNGIYILQVCTLGNVFTKTIIKN